VKSGGNQAQRDQKRAVIVAGAYLGPHVPLKQNQLGHPNNDHQRRQPQLNKRHAGRYSRNCRSKSNLMSLNGLTARTIILRLVQSDPAVLSVTYLNGKKTNANTQERK
jgi:hypothetical protein